MKKLTFILLLFYTSFLNGQNISEQRPQTTPVSVTSSLTRVLSEVKQNNLKLQGLSKIAEANRIENKSGLLPPNPEIEYNYLWGQVPLTENRQDLRITQTIDFPTTYFQKAQIAALKNRQSYAEYQKEYLSVMHSARLLYIDISYLNALTVELSKRLNNANALAIAYEKRFNNGDADILEYNKALLNLANQKNNLYQVQIKKEKAMAELTALNGGKLIVINDTTPFMPVIENYEKWFQNLENENPEVEWLSYETKINEKQVNLNNSLKLPKITAGYMSESLPDESFKGVTVGMTIPLWENKNKVKSAKVRSQANKQLYTDIRQQYYLNLKAAHEKAVSMIMAANEYRETITLHTNAIFLEKALTAGEISLIEYLTELSFYYENVNTLLELEYEAGKAAGALYYYSRE